MIRLEKFERRDYEGLISWIKTEEELMQFAGPAFSFPLTAAQLDESMSDLKRQAFKVVADGAATIGHAEIYLAEKSAYLGRILIGEPELRGKGIGRQIVDLLLHHVFEVLEQTEVRLNVFDWNLPAIRCYEKAGFVLNPVKKAERKVNGAIWTAVNMRMTREHWGQLSQIF